MATTSHSASSVNLLRVAVIETVNGSGVPIAAAAVPDNDNSKSNRTRAWLKSNWKRALEVFVLSSIIFFVYGLFTIPSVFYALPPLKSDEETSINISHSCLDDLSYSNNTLCLNASVKQPTESDVIVCTVDFYLDNRSLPVCTPHCKSWLNVTTADIVSAASLMITVISCAILFVIVVLQRDIIFVFPTVYLVYVSITVLFEGAFQFVVILFKGEAFCSSESLFESMATSSPFCTMSGILSSYSVAQITLFVTFHALGLGWSIMFPFHYRRFKSSGRIKYIHASTLTLCLVLPAVPALLLVIHGYVVMPGPFEFCVPLNIKIAYFTLALPICILMAVTTSVFIILFWRILKELLLKQLDHQRSKLKGRVTMAEVKIIVIMCYYVIVGTLAYSTYGYFLATDTGLRTFREFQEYATCQSIGIQADRPRDCGDAPDFRPLGTDVLVSASFILQLLLPLVILIFITNCRSCSKKRLKIFKVQRAASVS